MKKRKNTNVVPFPAGLKTDYERILGKENVLQPRGEKKKSCQNRKYERFSGMSRKIPTKQMTMKLAEV